MWPDFKHYTIYISDMNDIWEAVDLAGPYCYDIGYSAGAFLFEEEQLRVDMAVRLKDANIPYNMGED